MRGQLIPSWLAAWLANLVLGALGLLLFRWRDRVADQPIRVFIPDAIRNRIAERTQVWDASHSPSESSIVTSR